MKLHMISTRIELRSTLNVLGIVSDQKDEEKNKEDVFKAIDLTRNLNKEDQKDCVNMLIKQEIGNDSNKASCE